MILIKLGDIVIKYWRVILLALILSTTFYYKTRYNATVQELATFKDKIATLEAVKARENEILRDYAKNTVINITEKHNDELKGIKNAFIKQNKLYDITIGNLRNRLRESIGSADDVSEVATNTEGTAEEWRERYAAIARQYETLKQGCAITTSDFNSCRAWADVACLQVGCE